MKSGLVERKSGAFAFSLPPASVWLSCLAKPLKTCLFKERLLKQDQDTAPLSAYDNIQ